MAFAVPDIGRAWVLRRDMVLAGQLWPLLTGHLVHFGPAHLVYNLLAFGVAGWLVETRGRRHCALLYLVTAPTIGVVLMFTAPGMIRYGGLSGVACGFLCYAAMIGLADTGSWRSVCVSMLCLLCIKVGLEYVHLGSLLPYGSQQVFMTMPTAHLTGVVTALAYYYVERTVNCSALTAAGETAGHPTLRG